MCRPSSISVRCSRGFSIVELMAATAILTLILLVIFGISQQASTAWKSARSKIEAFQSARLAFENITATLSRATLNTYYDYFDDEGRPARDPGFRGAHHYGRQSDLHFISGKTLVPNQVTHSLFFQTPAGYDNDGKFEGMDTLLNACGFYIIHDIDNLRPSFLLDSSTIPNPPPNGTRYRLMQFLQPSHKLGVYSSATGSDWFALPLGGDSPPVQQLAENVIAMVILPRKSGADADASNSDLSKDYEYDSRLASASSEQLPTENQLPPLVDVALVAIDEASALRLGDAKLDIIEQLFLEKPKVQPEIGEVQPDKDLGELEKELSKQRFIYRIFRTVVPLRNSKWSS